MHSFISSSNDRLPFFPWRRIGVLTAVSLAALLAVWNVFWMSAGVPLQPRDDGELWNYHRRRASSAGLRACVFAGSSRIKAGIDLKVVEERGKIPFQLALAGKSPLSLLKNLAADESFNGTVVAEITEYIVYSQPSDDEKDWISSYEENARAFDYLFPAESFAKSLVAAPNLGDTTSEALTNILTGKVFDPDFVNQMVARRAPTTSFNRSSQGYADHSTPEQIALRQKFSIDSIVNSVARETPDKAKFLLIARKIEDYTRRIEARGGRVVLVNFPLGGEVKKLNDEYFPRTDFWNALAAISSARTIYYADDPSLAAIETLDGTHFSGRSATLFTRRLFEIIEDSD